MKAVSRRSLLASAPMVESILVKSVRSSCSRSSTPRASKRNRKATVCSSTRQPLLSTLSECSSSSLKMLFTISYTTLPICSSSASDGLSARMANSESCQPKILSTVSRFSYELLSSRYRSCSAICRNCGLPTSSSLKMAGSAPGTAITMLSSMICDELARASSSRKRPMRIENSARYVSSRNGYVCSKVAAVLKISGILPRFSFLYTTRIMATTCSAKIRIASLSLRNIVRKISTSSSSLRPGTRRSISCKISSSSSAT